MEQAPIGTQGIFLGRLLSHSVVENADTGSIQLTGRAQLTHAWDEKTEIWDPVEHEYFVFVNFTLRGTTSKGGNWDKKALTALAAVFGWTDGDFEALADMDLSNQYIQFTCKTENNQNGVDRVRGAFLTTPEEKPRNGKSDPETMKKLSASHGSAVRALISGVGSNPIFNPTAKDDMVF